MLQIGNCNLYSICLIYNKYRCQKHYSVLSFACRVITQSTPENNGCFLKAQEEKYNAWGASMLTIAMHFALCKRRKKKSLLIGCFRILLFVSYAFFFRERLPIQQQEARHISSESKFFGKHYFGYQIKQTALLDWSYTCGFHPWVLEALLLLLCSLDCEIFQLIMDISELAYHEALAGNILVKHQIECK